MKCCCFWFHSEVKFLTCRCMSCICQHLYLTQMNLNDRWLRVGTVHEACKGKYKLFCSVPSKTTSWTTVRPRKKRHVFVKHGCPRWQQSPNMAKISKSYILTPPNPQGYVMSMKCEEPIDELTAQVWLLYHHPNYKYCTSFVSGTELGTEKRTDGRTDRQTDDLITRCPRRTFQAGDIKSWVSTYPTNPILWPRHYSFY